jgi:putative sulfotransferase
MRTDAPPTFVVSTGRCGSTFLSQILARHPEILSVSEFLFSMGPQPFPDGEITGEGFAAMLSRRDPLQSAALIQHGEPVEFSYPVDAGLRFNRETGVPAIASITLVLLTKDFDQVYDEIVAFAGSLQPAPIATQYRRLFDWLRERYGRRLWVERSGGSLGTLPGIVQHFPDARFIHLYRDGREAAISMSKRGQFRLIFVGAEVERLTGVNPFLDPDADLPDLPEPLASLLPGTIDLQVLEGYDVPLERFGLHWSALVLRGIRQLDRLSEGRVLPLAYEDLVTDPPGSLNRVAAFLGVDVPDGWVEWAVSSARRNPSNWARLDEPEKGKLDAACRIANRRLYGPDGPRVFT